MGKVRIQDLVGLPEVELTQLSRLIECHQRLSDVLRWCAEREPAVVPILTVAQDEYSHDVVIPYAEDLYLVYGST